MKLKQNTAKRNMIGLGMVGFAALHSANATTQITFGSFTQNNVDISSISGYGSNVTVNNADYIVSPGAAGFVGTPNIELTWGVGYDTYTGWDGRGNVAQTDFNAGAELDLTFAPVPGYGVLVSSFDLDAWSGAAEPNMNVSWSIFDNVGTLASGVWARTDGGRDTISTGIGAGSVRIGEVVTLRFNLNSGTTSYIAMANLTFDQVPEPSTIALCAAGLGLGALAMRRRRK